MKAILVPIGVLLASVSISASAASPAAPGEAQYQQPTPLRSTLTRADVNADLSAFIRESGARPSYGEAYPAPTAGIGARSRDQALEEVRALHRQGISLPRGEAS